MPAAAHRPPPRLSLRLDGVSKRFARQWVIRDLNGELPAGSITGLRGGNGSGKTTLLRMLAGQLTPTRGRVVYALDDTPLAVGGVFPYVSWTGPYLEVVEELPLLEFLDFHFTFKRRQPGFGTSLAILEAIGLAGVRNRKLADCSSGMRQRVVLATALYAATPLLLLDEPTLTLDETAAGWFQAALERQATNRTVVIASNDDRDLVACSRFIELA